MGSPLNLPVHNTEDCDDDEYHAPTKVGPMSHAAIAQMMRDAEAEAQRVESRPLATASGVRAAIKSARVMEEGIPVVGRDEEGDFEPTVLSEHAAALAAKAAMMAKDEWSDFEESAVKSRPVTVPPRPSPSPGTEHVARDTSERADAQALGSLSSDLEPTSPEDPSAPILSPLMVADSGASSSEPLFSPALPADVQAQPPRAAFPEWLGVTLHRDQLERRTERALLIQIGIGVGVFALLTPLLLWLLF